MKTFTLISALLLSLSSTSQSVNLTLEVSAGVVHGTNRVVDSAVKISDSPYEIYKDVYKYERNTRGAVQWAVGAFFRNADDRPVAEVSVGLHTGIDRFNPVFLQLRTSAAALHSQQWTIMPYTGVSHWIASVDHNIKGWNMIGGIQILRWVEGEKIGRQSWFAIIDYTHRHTTITFGIKSHFK